MTQKDEISNLIKKCKWRKSVHGADMCFGLCLPCAMAVDKGKCDMLKKFSKEVRSEEK